MLDAISAFVPGTATASMAGLAAALIMLAATPLVIRLARRMNWVAHPKQDRWHTQSTALMGGIAIFASAAVAFFVFGGNPALGPLWLGGAIMFGVGLIDDLHGVRPATKLVAQVIATSILIMTGYAFGGGLPAWIHIPLTFVWVIGITNAVNLLDNMDGLAGGITAIAAAMLAGFSWLAGSMVGVGSALAVAGAAAAFLVFNFKPARIFMGDCGSLFLGYMIAALAVVVQNEVVGDSVAVYLVSAVVLAVPILDTTLVTLVRPAAGRSVKQGGRDHTSHRLVFLGLSERNAVLVLYVISIVFGGLGLLFHVANTQLFFALVIFMGIALAAFGVFLGGLDVYANEPDPQFKLEGWIGRLQRITYVVLGYGWKTMFGVVADVLLVVAAFICAYQLRFESGVNPTQADFIAEVLPIVLLVKVPLFYAMGMYRGIWRYAGTPELIRIVKATVLASMGLALVLAALYGFPSISKGVIVIDWMIVTIAVAAVRFSFRALPRYIATKRLNGRRALLYGAGDAGMLALSEIRQNPSLNLQPVAFLDDDRSKVGHILQGLPVAGTWADLARVCSGRQIEELVITSSLIDADRVTETRQICRSIGVPCRVLSLRIGEVPAPVVGRIEPAIAKAS